MSSKMLAALCLVSLALSATAAAQSNDVTFSIPLNLTRLLPDLSKVAVECNLRAGATGPFGADGATGRTELTVAGGQLVTTATVLVPVGTANPTVGSRVTYACTLAGFSAAQQTWSALNPPGNSANPNLALMLYWNSPEPQPNRPSTPALSGEFWW